MARDMRAWGAFVGASAIWGTTFLVISVGNEQVPPVWAAALRLLLAAPALALLAIATRAQWPKGKALGAAALYGFLNFGLNFGLLYWGEAEVASGVAAVFYATIPLSSALFAWSFGLERLAPRRILGALVAVSGVAVVFAGELTADVSPIRLVAILAAATCAALSGIALKRAPPQDVLPANAIGAAVGAVALVIGAALDGEVLAIPTTWDAWWPILYLTAAGSLGAYLLWTWLLKRWPVTSASMVAVVVPVLAVAAGIIARGERATLLTFAGAALVIVGVVLVVWRAHDAERSMATTTTSTLR